MKRTGYTLMLVEQNATRALAIADRAYVSSSSAGTASKAPAPSCSSIREVKRLYLGG